MILWPDSVFKNRSCPHSQTPFLFLFDPHIFWSRVALSAWQTYNWYWSLFVIRAVKLSQQSWYFQNSAMAFAIGPKRRWSKSPASLYWRKSSSRMNNRPITVVLKRAFHSYYHRKSNKAIAIILTWSFPLYHRGNRPSTRQNHLSTYRNRISICQNGWSSLRNSIAWITNNRLRKINRLHLSLICRHHRRRIWFLSNLRAVEVSR